MKFSARLFLVLFVISMFNGCAIIFRNSVGPPSDVVVEVTPERIERGRYLAEHVSLCFDCHSERNFDYFSGPINAGTEGMGGMLFGKDLGIPGDIYASNITPAAIGEWTDGEIIRAIAEGLGRDGRALFPVMPYAAFNHMSQEDLYSIVAFIRTLKPIANEVPKSKINFPVKYFVRKMPKPWTPAVKPDPSDILAYGEYMTHISGCADCHTPLKRGSPDKKRAFAGGNEYPFDWGTPVSANITPDNETGIGFWDKEDFVDNFKAYVPEYEDGHPVYDLGGSDNTVMSWYMYSGMTEEDLGAIYEYLRTVKPISTPPPEDDK